MHAPEIRRVVVEDRMVRILALDNFAVTAVKLELYDHTGVLVEEGAATKTNGQFNWQYQVKRAVTVRVMVKAFDAAGNMAEQETFVEGTTSVIPVEECDATGAELSAVADPIKKDRHPGG